MDRRDSTRLQRNRSQIAQTAARLIAEHGLVDWNLAKRKACRELGLPDREALPDNDEIEQALRDYNSLFDSDEQPVRLRRQRQEALQWMERLSGWKPVLVGAVAAGWATAHSEICIELEAEDAKSVELELINTGVSYSSIPPPATNGPQVQLRLEERALRLVVVTAVERRNRPRRGANQAETRISLPQLRALLDEKSAA